MYDTFTADLEEILISDSFPGQRACLEVRRNRFESKKHLMRKACFSSVFTFQAKTNFTAKTTIMVTFTKITEIWNIL